MVLRLFDLGLHFQTSALAAGTAQLRAGRGGDGEVDGVPAGDEICLLTSQETRVQQKGSE